jgi:hypothetical protein
MGKVIEFEAPPRDENEEQYVKLVEVLNMPIVIESFFTEEATGTRGKYESLTMVTDKGTIRTGAKVLVKQLKAKKDVFDAGNKLRAVIKMKPSKAGGTYYYFDHP